MARWRSQGSNWRNKNLNEDDSLDSLDEENTSEDDEPTDGDSTSKEDDALNDWKDERAENERACNKKHHILEKEQKKKLYAGVFSITYFMPKIMALLYRWTEVCFLSDSVYVINLG